MALPSPSGSPDPTLTPVPQERVITDAMREQLTLDSAILRTLFEELLQEWGTLEEYRDFYDGDQELVYGTDKFRDYFPDFEGFEDNWCAPVIDAMADKIELIGVDVDVERGEEGEGEREEAGEVNPIAERIWNVLRDNNIDEQSADLTEGVFVEGRASVIVWPDEELGARVDWNPAQLVKVRYSEEDYRKIDFAVKRWVTPSGQINVNIYTDKEVRKYWSQREVPDNTQTRGTGVSGTIPKTAPTPGLNFRFVGDEPWPLPHNFGEVPVVEFPNKRGSELSDVIPLQKGINYLLIATFIASEFSALRQRVFFTHLKEPEGGWKSGPGQIWHLQPMLDSDGKALHGDMKEFQASDLSQYRQIIEMILQHLALTSKTPVRMFFKSDRGGRGDAPSGASQLIEDEPLLDKVEDRINRLDSKWFQVVKLIAKAIGETTPIRGKMIWQDARSKYRDDLLNRAVKMAGSRERGTGLGLPIEWVVKQMGLTPHELASLERALQKQLEEMEAQRQEQLQAETQAAQNQGNQGNGSPGSQQGSGEESTD